MNKTEAGLLGAAIVTLIIFVYGIRNQMGWKYWVFTLLFLPYTGAMIGVAFGKESPEDKLEQCRERECKDKGGTYIDGKCQKRTFDAEKGLFDEIIPLTTCGSNSGGMG